jgi:hypothetical protein
MVALFASLMVALLVVGFTYAMWFETLTIKGTLTTGSFDVDLSLCHVFEIEDEEKPWVANATANLSADNKTLTITVEDAYPCYTFVVVFDIDNRGTVPAKLTNFDVWGNITYANGTEVELEDIPEWIKGNWSLWKPSSDPHVNLPDESGTDWDTLFAFLEGYQLDGGDTLVIAVQFHIFENLQANPPIEPPEGAMIEFELTFDAIQWNEY